MQTYGSPADVEDRGSALDDNLERLRRAAEGGPGAALDNRCRGREN
ncbi:MAG TPA: hypothetical protein VFX25_22020 [Streptosporangiaceae bacterium]|nr:hypothetical protein [Streptosporangiaceae bacterium]